MNKNRHHILLSFFIVLPTALQSAEQNNSLVTCKMGRLQELLLDYRELTVRLGVISRGIPPQLGEPPLVWPLMEQILPTDQKNVILAYSFNQAFSQNEKHHYYHFDPDMLEKNPTILAACKQAFVHIYRNNGKISDWPPPEKKIYSPLGIRTIAEHALYREKEQFILQLLTFGFTPTLHDKELALLEKWYRCKSILDKMCLLQCAKKNDSGFSLSLLSDIITHICLLMFGSEESLL